MAIYNNYLGSNKKGNKTVNNTENDSNTTVTNVNNSETSEPVDLITIPDNNPDHESSPESFHETTSVTCKLHSTFEEAKAACDLIFLRPGEAHTEFYKEDGVYHCVVAIGNINPNYGHVYLTDSGSSESLDERLNDIHEEVVQLGKQFSVVAKDVSVLNADVARFELNIEQIIDQITQDINEFKSQVTSQVDNLTELVNTAVEDINDISTRTARQIKDISTYVSNFNDRITSTEEAVINHEIEINRLNTSVNALERDSQKYQANINAINSSIVDIKLKDIDQDTEIEYINERINIVNSSIDTINGVLSAHTAQLDEHTNNINDVSLTVSVLNNVLNDIEDKLEDVSIAVDTNTNDIDELNDKVAVADLSINTISNSILDMQRDIAYVSEHLETAEQNININAQNISNLDGEIGEINIKLTNLNTKIDNTSIDLQIEQYHNGVQDASINSLNSVLNDISTRIENKFEELQVEKQRNDTQDVSISILNASIYEIQQLINEFKPIEDASIYPLFHDDIYTINLCCYTAGGHIEINDGIAGINAGGTSDRVAECTPFNEYKTYVQGDTVQFTAVENPGYRFVCWYKDGDTASPIFNKTVSYTFGDDINVIGSLLDGTEPGILQYGYTAKFKKMHNLQVSINRKTNNDNTAVRYFNDTLDITITEPGMPTRTVSMEDAVAGHVYYDDGTKIKVVAKPDVEGYHDFIKYLISDGIDTIEWTDSTYLNRNATTSYVIDAFFIEYWIRVHADANPHEAGFINIVGGPKQISPDLRYTYFLAGAELRLSANANPHWGFTTWGTDNNHPSIIDFERDIYPYRIEDDPIKLRVNKLVDEYEIVASFTEGGYVRATYYMDDTYMDQFGSTQKYEPGDIIIAPEEIPTKEGHSFVEWICENPDYHIGDTIDRDLRFYATWRAGICESNFYVDDVLHDGPIYTEWGTPLIDLHVDDPSEDGRVFNGWVVNQEIVDDNYLIEGDTRFDASFPYIEYYTAFQVDDVTIQDGSVNWGTRLESIQPANPSKDGYEFRGWAVDSEIVPSTYEIKANTIFDASFAINKYNVDFISNGENIKSATVDWNSEFVNIKPADPSNKIGYTFKYWKWNDTDVSVLDTDRIVADSSFNAEFEKSTVIATFVNYDGSILQESELNSGDTPEYIGNEPKRDIEHDPITDIYTEYTFEYWDPDITPITEDTTYTAIYSSRRFKYVTTTKYIREVSTNDITEEKEYILVSSASSESADQNIVISGAYDTGKNVFSSISAHVDKQFQELTEFEFEDGTVLYDFIMVKPVGNSLYYLKDLSDDGYLTSVSSNKFGAKVYNEELIDNYGTWTLNSSMNIANIGTSRTIQYNTGAPRFAPYLINTQVASFLFYKNVSTEKEYIIGLMASLQNNNQNNIAHASNVQYIEVIGEDE